MGSSLEAKTSVQSCTSNGKYLIDIVQELLKRYPTVAIGLKVLTNRALYCRSHRTPPLNCTRGLILKLVMFERNKKQEKLIDPKFFNPKVCVVNLTKDFSTHFFLFFSKL